MYVIAKGKSMISTPVESEGRVLKGMEDFLDFASSLAHTHRNASHNKSTPFALCRVQADPVPPLT